MSTLISPKLCVVELTEQQRQTVRQLADRLVAKLMHPCVRTLRESQGAGPAVMLVEAFHDTRISVVGA